MNIDSWLKANTESLKGKRVALTGSTGGIGTHLVDYLASLGAELILLDRSCERQSALCERILSEYPDTLIHRIRVDMSDMQSVKAAAGELISLSPHVFIHNAGAYSIPRYITAEGYDNVFTINFIAPYYIIRELLPTLRENRGRVVAVGSVAHNYSKSDPEDVDFHTRGAASKVYGNAKRYLMFSLYELFKNEKEATLSVTHPGITFTGITDHYPKVIFALIKHPMKVIFMRPRKACLSILRGVFEPCGTCEWIGPRYFGVWGKPKKKLLKTCPEKERDFIGKAADKIYREL